VLSDSSTGTLVQTPEARRRRFRGASWTRAWWPSVWPPALAFLVAVLAWQFLPGPMGLPVYILPTPTAIWATVVRHGPEFVSAIVLTSVTSFAGFAISAVLGVFGALVMAGWKPLERTLYPYAIILSTVPIISIAPLVVIWFGTGTLSILVITFIVGFFPIVANTLVGLQSASSTSVDLFRVYHASKLQMMLKLRFPTSLPFIMAALKVTATLAVIGTIVGEYVAGTGGGNGGLGYIVIVASNRLETAYVFAAAIAAALLGILFFALASLLSMRVLGSWHESAMKAEQ
jgi:NitT/TauT family transport system permease protein